MNNLIVAIVIVVGLAASAAASHAFYGSMKKDGLPPWQCYDNPADCR